MFQLVTHWSAARRKGEKERGKGEKKVSSTSPDLTLLRDERYIETLLRNGRLLETM